MSPPAGHGRHRAAPPPSSSRLPSVAGAAVVAVAAVGAITTLNSGALNPLGASSAAADSVALTDGGGATTPPTADLGAVASPADERAARDQARELLAARVAGVENLAVKAAQAAAAPTAALSPARVVALQKACQFNPKIQRQSPSGPYNSTQLKNAQTIVDVAQQLGLPMRAAVIALATAQQESELINMHGGDRDSEGLFQQRPSMGWGTPAQVTNPVYAAKQFYSALGAVPGWQHLPLTVAAQTVQASAFGWAYARWEGIADAVVAQLTGDTSPVDLSCTPRN